MTAHCATCNCQDEPVQQPSTASRWAIDQAKRAADEAVKRAKEKRLAAAKQGKSGPEPILTTEQHRELMRWSSPVIEGEVADAPSASQSDERPSVGIPTTPEREAGVTSLTKGEDR